MAGSYDSLKAQYESAGQGHVFTFYDTLKPDEQAGLLSQLASIDPAHVNDIFKQAMEADAAASSSSAKSDDISPPPSGTSGSPSTADPATVERWSKLGLQAVSEGKVGIILLAGGQGTRLGSSDPKGCYDIGLPSHKSLFQLQAERIGKLQQLAGGKGKDGIPWYVMTSGPTRKATEKYFKEHSYFGLKEENVVFFDQGVLPCLTNDGKIFLDTKSAVAVAPDGNGGIYAALRSKASTGRSYSILEDMHNRKVEYIYCYCVDNCLAKVGDPVFIGYCIDKKSHCGTKVVKKTDPKESVGVVALKNQKWNVIEYSEISKELSEAIEEESGELLYRAANIANHFYNIDFLDSIQSFSSSMAYHIARKKIPHVDLQSGGIEKPSKPNGVKMEQFIFDVLPFLDPLDTHGLFEVERKKEFSPLKNAPNTGADDPQTSRRDLLSLQKEWLLKAGAKEVTGEVELSPLLSYNGEGLEGVKGKTIKEGRAETVEELEKLCE